MASLKVSVGSLVKTKDGRQGTVKSLQQIKTGSRGRPPTAAIVEFTDGWTDDFGVRDLKVVKSA